MRFRPAELEPVLDRPGRAAFLGRLGGAPYFAVDVSHLEAPEALAPWLSLAAGTPARPFPARPAISAPYDWFAAQGFAIWGGVPEAPPPNCGCRRAPEPETPNMPGPARGKQG